MQIKVQTVEGGKIVLIERETTEQILQYIFSKNLGIKLIDGVLTWDCFYMFSDDHGQWEAGQKQEEFLEGLSLL